MTSHDYDALRQDLMRDESFRPSAYTDTRGLLTIGYGRLIDAKKGGGITKEEARFLLENDMMRALKGVSSAFPWAIQTLNPVRYRVLVEMVFQLGLTGVLQFKKFLDYAEDGQYDKAAEQMLDSLWASQTPRRAQRLARMFQLGREI